METTVILIEDHPLFSKGLLQLIESEKGFVVVGEARNGEEALAVIREKKPQFAIVDLNLGDEDGLEIIKIIKQDNPSIFVLVLSMFDERYYAERALKAGAQGYIMKEEAPHKVIDAIKTILSGKIWLSENEREHLYEYISGTSVKETDKWCASINTLSNRQLQIFNMIGKGLGTIEIANKLSLSTKTIDAHKEHIKQKLHCNSSQELRQLAVECNSRLISK